MSSDGDRLVWDAWLGPEKLPLQILVDLAFGLPPPDGLWEAICAFREAVDRCDGRKPGTPPHPPHWNRRGSSPRAVALFDAAVSAIRGGELVLDDKAKDRTDDPWPRAWIPHMNWVYWFAPECFACWALESGVDTPALRRMAGREVAPPPNNSFRRDGNAWTVRYQGGPPKVYSHQRGMQYIAELLRLSPTEASASQLLAAAVGEVLPEPGSAGENADRQQLKEYHERYEDLEDQITEAEADNDPGRLEAFTKEREALAREIAQGKGPGGVLRKAKSDQLRAKDSVRRAIQRALSEIAKNDEHLRNHLKNNLKLSDPFFYRFDPPIDWDVKI